MKIDENDILITEEDIANCWQYYRAYLADILNGEYPVEQAREDLISLIGSEYDKRKKTTNIGSNSLPQ